MLANISLGLTIQRCVLMELWQTWCMRWTENPVNVVRFHEVPLKYIVEIPERLMGRSAKSLFIGSNPILDSLRIHTAN